jgi:arabinose-5-phosphate isomerase
VITDGDLRRNMSTELVSLKAGDVMTGGAKSITPGMLASEAVGFMNAHTITNVFVVDDGHAVGILHIHDCLRAGVA